jgi:hypothetical protein
MAVPARWVLHLEIEAGDHLAMWIAGFYASVRRQTFVHQDWLRR